MKDELFPLGIENVKDLLTTALEGGSNYWYIFDCTEVRKATEPMKGQPLVDRIWHYVWEQGNSLVFNDNETDEPLGSLSYESLKNAVKLLVETQPKHYANILKEDWDAETGDVFFQLTIMGEVVYG